VGCFFKSGAATIQWQTLLHPASNALKTAAPPVGRWLTAETVLQIRYVAHVCKTGAWGGTGTGGAGGADNVMALTPMHT